MIVGAGGLGSEVRSMLPHCGYAFGGFFDDDHGIQNARSLNEILPDQSYVIAVGNSRQRRDIFDRLPVGLSFPNLIHPLAHLQEKASIALGRGIIITAGSILTCKIQVGDFCIINLNCTIGHEVKMAAFCSLMPAVNLGGMVVLEEGVYIGTGATVLPGVHIGKNAVVGAGAVVTKDVASGATVKGIPAR